MARLTVVCEALGGEDLAQLHDVGVLQLLPLLDRLHALGVRQAETYTTWHQRQAETYTTGRHHSVRRKPTQHDVITASDEHLHNMTSSQRFTYHVLVLSSSRVHLSSWWLGTRTCGNRRDSTCAWDCSDAAPVGTGTDSCQPLPVCLKQGTNIVAQPIYMQSLAFSRKDRKTGKPLVRNEEKIYLKRTFCRREICRAKFVFELPSYISVHWSRWQSYQLWHYDNIWWQAVGCKPGFWSGSICTKVMACLFSMSLKNKQ